MFDAVLATDPAGVVEGIDEGSEMHNIICVANRFAHSSQCQGAGSVLPDFIMRTNAKIAKIKSNTKIKL